MRPLLLVIASFIAMEPITAATHRWVMHGRGPGRILQGLGVRLHRSHHRRRIGRIEANDAFPVIFAALVCLGMWIGFNLPGLDGLVWVGIGVTAYGVAYAAVHDVYIHGRVPALAKRRQRLLERLAAAHRIHHLYNGAPYGMLVPIVPRHLRERARSASSPDVPDGADVQLPSGAQRIATRPRS